FACFTCGSDKHFKRDCPKNKEVDNKRLNVNKVSTEGTELVDGTVAARVDLLGIFGPAVKCPLVYVPIGLATGGQVNVVHQQSVMCFLQKFCRRRCFHQMFWICWEEPRVKRVVTGSKLWDLRDSGNAEDETEVSSVFWPEKSTEHIEDSQRNITHVGMKWEHWVLRMRR
ncbi:hypothetical protein TNCV_334921, partial [Trichonephila clavipes]